MKYFRHKTKQREITVYPIVCMHVGVEQSDTSFIEEHVQRILDDPNGVAVYLGDAGECNLKSSKGDVYRQHLSPQEQLNAAHELLAPLSEAERLLFGISGNHGRRIERDTGVEWDNVLCSMLRVPYLGLSAFMRLEVGQRVKVKYDCFFHHGTSGSISMGGKVSAAKKFEPMVQADALFTAHTHTCIDLPPEAIAVLPTSQRKISYRNKHSYICGCGYDSRTGYAEEKGYPPILPAYLGVTFSAPNAKDLGQEGSKEQVCQIWRRKP